MAREAGAGPWGQAWRARGWALHRQKGWQGHGSEDSAPAPVRPGLPPGCLWTKSVSFPRGGRSARRKELFSTRAQSRLEQDARHPRARLSLAAVQGAWAGRQGAPKLMDTPGKTFWAPRTGAAQGRALEGAGFRPHPQLDASPKCWRSPLPSPLPTLTGPQHCGPQNVWLVVSDGPFPPSLHFSTSPAWAKAPCGQACHLPAGRRLTPGWLSPQSGPDPEAPGADGDGRVACVDAGTHAAGPGHSPGAWPRL